MRHNDWSTPSLLLLALLLVALATAACGGSASSGDDGNGRARAPEAVPTMPPARFTAVAEQSVTRTLGVTTTATVTAPAEVTSTATVADAPAVDPALLERGARAYERNNCASCHGAAGEGVEGQGAAIAGTTLNEAEFTDLLRTGGGLGNSHIFGPSAISPGGMTALYLYVQSLQ
jgi:mono/diheme cytochrome c family protein